MGLRGPKPAAKGRLTFKALQYANYLFTLRDGQLGRARVLGGGLPVEFQFTVESLEASRELAKKSAKPEGVSFEVIAPPIQGNPAAWEQLKRARTEEDLRHATEDIRRWAGQVERADWKTEFPDFLWRHAGDLIRAKRGWNYPADASRPTSDDKRIFFFAKTLAGLSLGLSPTYTAKLLSRWEYADREWIQGFFVASEQSFGGQVVDFQEQSKPKRKPKRRIPNE